MTSALAGFESLRDVKVDCDPAGCLARGTMDLPTGGDALVGYEAMMRNGVRQALQSRGYALSEPIQVEESGGTEIRLILRVARLH